MNYNRLNNITGWTVFAIAFIVYSLTVAPTASFWDCGEFIACANELEVTHPPGAPLFLMLGRIMAMFSFGNVANVAFLINMISVLTSAFTAMFTCWITTAFAYKILKNSDKEENDRNIGIMIAGLVAGLTCTFADSIWFNAVEAEVYATSGFFTAIVVWLMMKWDVRANEEGNLRWLILIAYLMGLSIGVHLLNLLTIPALALMYYFRKFNPTWKGIAATMGISIAALAFIQYGIIQYTFSLGQSFELFFTGSVTREGVDTGGMGMGMGIGTMILGLIILAITVGLLWYSQKSNKPILNTIILCYTVIMIGFSSYTVIFVRSGSNPGIDMNNPENIMTFLSYMRREQYGDRPLFYGPRYCARPIALKEEGMRYTIWDGAKKYIEDEEKQAYDYKPEDNVFFPRMYSGEARHLNDPDFGYVQYVSKRGNPQTPYDDQPSYLDDLNFAFTYQFVHMYMRYFMWNFVGRTSDVQDYSWEDGLLLKNEAMKDNKGNNHYFFLPFILGIMGFVWQFSYSKRNAAIVGMLFFFTGIAIIIYLNQPPQQPRERDYAYASSFQTFCIWIGLGVLFLIETLSAYLKNKTTYIVGAFAMLAPIIMCAENWDDHTRKNRWIDVDFAYNLLNSCAANAIVFTAGDNDTFPLWYIQEVEGVRPDVRVVNLELLISDWYIEQMQHKVNESEPLPITMKKNDYAGEAFNFYPFTSRIVRLPINKEAVIKNGLVKAEDANRIADTLVWNVKANGRGEDAYLLRKDSCLLNIVRNVAAAGWNRPIYFANTIPSDSYMGLDNYLQMEGFAHRLVPLKMSAETPRDMYSEGSVNQELMFDNLIKKFRYRGLDDAKVNFDDHIRNTIVSNYRNTFHRLATTYSEQINKADFQLEMAKMGAVAADTLAKMGVTAEQVQRENPAKIAAAKAKLVEVDAFTRKIMPYNVLKPSLNYLITNAQMLFRGDMTEAAKTEFAFVEKESLSQLANFAAQKVAIDPRHPAFQGAYMCAQYYMETGREPEGLALGDKLAQITGDTRVKEMLLKMKK